MEITRREQEEAVQAPPTLSAAQALARFARRQMEAPTTPERVTNKTMQLVVDQIGLQLGCAELPWSRAVHDYIASFSALGPATVVAYGGKVHPEHAAFANATFGHGQDFDDTCMRVQTHVGASVIPVAIAVGEEVGASGEAVLRAASAGLEVMLRVAHSVSPGCLRRGHHTPPAAGPFGAAVAAGLLRDLSAPVLTQAIAIAGSFSGGLIEYTQGGGSVKRIHSAIPTTAGIRAASLAAAGLTGPVSVLDGQKGFCRVYSDTPAPERLTADLDETFLLDDVGLKAYNCCYFIHAPIEALLEIVRVTGTHPDDIDRIDVGTCAHGRVHVGSIAEPTDQLGAQFSVQFSLALALLREAPGIDSYTTAQLDDPQLRDFARRVSVHEDQAATAEYPGNWGSIVTVKTRGGRTYRRRVRFPRGTAENPMSNREIWEKFSRNTEPVLGPRRSAEVRDCLTRLYQLGDIRELTALLKS
jgi:2-methylcitrate dehydratase PrpD